MKDGRVTSHLNLTKTLKLPPLNARHRAREEGRINLAPYRDTPVDKPARPNTFAGFDPEENLDW